MNTFLVKVLSVSEKGAPEDLDLEPQHGSIKEISLKTFPGNKHCMDRTWPYPAQSFESKGFWSASVDQRFVGLFTDLYIHSPRSF